MENGGPERKETMEAEKKVYFASCPCGYSEALDVAAMLEGKGQTEEDILQLFWGRHDEKGYTAPGPLADYACTAQFLKIEKIEPKKKE